MIDTMILHMKLLTLMMILTMTTMMKHWTTP